MTPEQQRQYAASQQVNLPADRYRIDPNAPPPTPEQIEQDRRLRQLPYVIDRNAAPMDPEEEKRLRQATILGTGSQPMDFSSSATGTPSQAGGASSLTPDQIEQLRQAAWGGDASAAEQLRTSNGGMQAILRNALAGMPTAPGGGDPSMLGAVPTQSGAAPGATPGGLPSDMPEFLKNYASGGNPVEQMWKRTFGRLPGEASFAQAA
jgi:hypothetical protein